MGTIKRNYDSDGSKMALLSKEERKKILKEEAKAAKAAEKDSK